MCQHVRGRRAGSSQRGDRETGVPLRVPGCGPSQLHDVVVIVDIDGVPSAAVVVPPRWRPLDHDQHNDDDQQHNDDDEQHHDDDDVHVDEDQQRRRGRRRRRRSHLAGQEETPVEDAREIGEPRRCPGGLHDRTADLRVLPGCPDDGGKRHVRGSTVGAEEAGSSESLQPRSGGGRDARPVGRNGTPSRRFQNGFYLAAGSQGGGQAAYRRQDAFLSWPFSPGVQVRNGTYGTRFIIVPNDLKIDHEQN